MTSRITGFAVPTVAVAQPTPLSIPFLHAGASMSDRQSILALMVSTLRQDLKNDEDLVKVVVSLLVTAVPELAQSMNQTVAPTITMVSCDENRMLELLDVDGSGKPDPNLITFGTTAQTGALSVQMQTAIYSAVALVVYATGKQARESAPTAAEINRPKALIGKYTIPETEHDLFPGKPHGPSVRTLEHLFNAMAVYSGVRSQITLSLIGLETALSHYPPHIDAIITQFQLMRHAGLTHVGAIHALVEAHSWVVRVPELEHYFRIFCRDLVKFNTLSKHEQLYHRLLCAQPDFLFLTSELRPLIAVAGDFVAEVDKDFEGYVYNAQKYQDLCQKVRAFRGSYRSTAKLANIATALGLESIDELPDVVLPTTGPVQPQV